MTYTLAALSILKCGTPVETKVGRGILCDVRQHDAMAVVQLHPHDHHHHHEYMDPSKMNNGAARTTMNAAAAATAAAAFVYMPLHVLVQREIARYERERMGMAAAEAETR